MTTGRIVLWVYIGLMWLGGLMGFLKAGSKASLIASTIFAAVLALFAVDVLPYRYAGVILFVLLLFFGKRFLKGRKFMPSGLMVVLTLITLVLFYTLP